MSFAFDRFDPPIPGQAEVDNAKVNIVERFGYPKHIETTIQPNPSDPGYHSEVAHWKYDGLTITLSTPVIHMNPRSSMTSITLTGTDYNVQFGLNIGSHKLAYRKYLGNPARIEADTYLYRTGRYTNVNGIDFYSSQDIVIQFDDQGNSTSMTWAYAGH